MTFSSLYRSRTLWEKFKDLETHEEVAVVSLVALAMSLVMWLGYGVFGTEHQVGEISVMRWEWHVDVNRWVEHHYSDTGYKHPPNCRDKSECGGVRNYRYWETSYDITTTSYDADGNASSTTTTYYDDHYSYDHDEWRHHRTFTASGTDKSPHPPEYVLVEEPETTAARSRGDEVRNVRKPYSIVVKCEDGNYRTWNTTKFDLWDYWNKGDRCDVRLSGFGDMKSIGPLPKAAK